MDFEDFLGRLETRLDPLGAPAGPAGRSDFDLDPGFAPADDRVLKAAAVLAAIVRRPARWTMLFTERAEDLPSHPGQVSFPGGRVQPGETAVEAALREAEEELGVSRALFTPLGAWEPYETGTGYRITPIVALIEPGFALAPDPREVAGVFETPLSFLMNPANHEVRKAIWQGRERTYYAMPHDGKFIWGATAGMIRALYERLYT
ncbi:MAG: CoA pyrophosphatase [Hydrogenophilaceae bacterium]|jgi:8-oxo-dGTP pyrophosphatase MutT (NUDIX family)|nr:CoA pyrophosphatase [Hydrogenophilaceae bacterium]